MRTTVSSLDHGRNLAEINGVACQRLWDFPSEGRFSTNDLETSLVMRNPEIALEDRFEGVRKRAMTDIMKQSSYSENPGVVLGQASSLGVEERQSCYADTVVVAVVSEPGTDAVDRS